MNEALPSTARWPARAAAALVDGVVLVVFTLLWLVFLLHAGIGTEKPPGDTHRLASAIAGSGWLQATLLLALLLMLAFRLSLGATPGYLVLGLQVLRERDGSQCGAGLVVARGLALAVALAPLGLGVLSALWRRDGRGLHDRITGTRVVCEDESLLSVGCMEARL